jgi:hypothetical protein
MVDFHHGSGVIKYDPYRSSMKKRTTNWCIVKVDREITRYYRWWLQKEKHIILQQPSWDAHISVIRGEVAFNRKQQQYLWKKYDGNSVDFLYEHGEIRSHPDPSGGRFYWVDVECPHLAYIRKEMGLPVGWRFHITIGRTYY